MKNIQNSLLDRFSLDYIMMTTLSILLYNMCSVAIGFFKERLYVYFLRDWCSSKTVNLAYIKFLIEISIYCFFVFLVYCIAKIVTN